MTLTAERRIQRHYTIRDLALMPDDGKRREIINGELFVTTQPHDNHQFVCSVINAQLYNWNETAGLGAVIFAPGVIFSDDNAVAPDVVWLSSQRRKAIERDGKLHGPPELAVEVLSAGSRNRRRDREIKRDLYAARGVDEYWIVNWRRREVEVYRRDPATATFGSAVVLRNDDLLESPVLPGFACKISKFFAYVV